MKKFTLLFLSFFLFGTLMAQRDADCYDFDELSAGGYVAEQLGGSWTTWNGTPGGDDDAMVSDDYSHSPNNSFVVGPDVDLVFKLAEEPIETGAWLFSNYIYVPSGFSGYFNVQSNPVPGEEWIIEMYFNDDGTGYFENGSADTYDYAMDSWIFIEINLDLDADLAQVFFDGNLMTEFENTFTIGGIDYWADDSGGIPGAYYDDVCFGEGTPISNDDCYNFDALDPGEFLALQLGGMWTTWSGTPGGDDDSFVSDDQSHSPNNSFVIFENIADVVFKLADEPIETGAWLYSHYIYIAEGATGYFNVQSSPIPGEEWVIHLNFDDDGTGYFEGGSLETFDYVPGTWILVEINFDLDSDLAQVFFDGNLMIEFANEFTIGGINYYGDDDNGPPEAYYDDVCIGEGTPISPAGCFNFDDLDAGEFLALQLGGMWTTWSDTPGGDDDTFVSDDQSHSPGQSFVIFENIADVVFKLADEPIETGAWLYSNYIYIAEGATGYFNVQSSPIPGEEWVIELWFNDDGTGYFEGGSSDTFDYAPGTWILVEINFDLDSDLAQVYFDGNLMTDFANEFTIGGINYYGNDDNGAPEAYYDDVCFGEGWPLSVGIEDISTKEEVNIYPNPAGDIVHINTSSDVEKIQLVSISGQLILEQNTFGNQINLNISEIETGIYFVRIFSHDKVITKKLVIE